MALRQNNRQASPIVRIKLRAVLHFGEISQDTSPTGEVGHFGKDVNLAFRLLDSETLRAELLSRNLNAPLALLLSERFFVDILQQELPILENDYQRVSITAKDGKYLAYGYRFRKSVSTSRRSSGKPRRKRHQRNRPAKTRAARVTSTTLDHLKHGSIYLSTTDVHNYALYMELAGQVPLQSHLDTSLLLAPHVVLHCTDPLRLKEVESILSQYQGFIETGRIVFLLGRTIEDIERDFPLYIRRKATQYLKSARGTTDLQSFGDDIRKRISRTVTLLQLSPIRLRRGYSGTNHFVNLVSKDLQPTEKLVVYSKHMLGKVTRLNLTLYQILHLERVDFETGAARPFLGQSHDEIDQAVEVIKEEINRDSFSRQILVDSVRDNLPAVKENSDINVMVRARTNLLHMHINIGISARHSFIENTPSRDQSSPYYYYQFFAHLGAIAGVAPRDVIGPDMALNLLKLKDEWNSFANYHLRVMAHLYSRRLADLNSITPVHFEDIKAPNRFSGIKRVVKRCWN